MERKIIFDDSIVLWWERGNFPADTQFTCLVNGEEYAKSNATYVEVKGLFAGTTYALKVVASDGTLVVDEKLTTQKAKKNLDVSKAPYFAVGDGKTLNTKALQRAFDDCDENSRVYIPAGTYVTGALRMKSNTELYVAENAVLQGSIEVEDYLPKIPSRFEGLEMSCYSALLNAGEMDHKTGPNCENIVIRGGGRIVGGGKALFDNVLAVEKAALKDYLEALGDKIKEYEKPDTIPARARPRLINISNAQNVVVANVGIEYGAAWNLHTVYSYNVQVYGCTFKSQGVWNGDGFDPDSCEDVALFGCIFETGDDCVAIKSGKNPEGNIINRKCANVYIFACEGKGHGISIGSEMSGGIENVYVWDCHMPQMPHGLHIKGTRKRGGYVKNVRVNNCTFSIVLVRAVGYNDDGEGASVPPEFSNFYIENSTITGIPFWGIGANPQERRRRYIVVRGFGEDAKVKNVYFKNLDIQTQEGDDPVYLENAENILFE